MISCKKCGSCSVSLNIFFSFSFKQSIFFTKLKLQKPVSPTMYSEYSSNFGSVLLALTELFGMCPTWSSGLTAVHAQSMKLLLSGSILGIYAPPLSSTYKHKLFRACSYCIFRNSTGWMLTLSRGSEMNFTFSKSMVLRSMHLMLLFHAVL